MVRTPKAIPAKRAAMQPSARYLRFCAILCDYLSPITPFAHNPIKKT